MARTTMKILIVGGIFKTDHNYTLACKLWSILRRNLRCFCNNVDWKRLFIVISIDSVRSLCVCVWCLCNCKHRWRNLRSKVTKSKIRKFIEHLQCEQEKIRYCYSNWFRQNDAPEVQLFSFLSLFCPIKDEKTTVNWKCELSFFRILTERKNRNCSAPAIRWKCKKPNLKHNKQNNNNDNNTPTIEWTQKKRPNIYFDPLDRITSFQYGT